jgi:amino acid permease
MIASIVIVILAFLFGSLSIFTQYTKNQEHRRKIEGAISIPATLAFFCAIAWLMSHAHHLHDLRVSPFALILALTFFLFVPAVTYIFSPASRDTARMSRRSR